MYFGARNFPSSPIRIFVSTDQNRIIEKPHDKSIKSSANKIKHKINRDVIHPKTIATSQVNDAIMSHNSNDVNSFHRAISPVLIVAQCFAIMPVDGVTAANAEALRFRWLNIRVFYSVFWFASVLIMGGTSVFYLILHEVLITLKNGGILFFYCLALTNMAFHLHLATKWPALMLKIHHFELSMKVNYGYPKNFARKLRIIAALILASSAFEHILSNFKSVRNAYKCTDGSFSFVTLYFKNNFSRFISLLGYSPVLPVFLQLTGFIATFSWNYMDLIIIMFSIMLTTQMKQINMRLETVRHKVTPARFWSEMYQDYSSWAAMVRLVDDHINTIVAVSFFNNLYFICLQLLNSIKVKRDAGDDIYFYVSFGHLLLRSTAMCLFAARIHEESRHPKSVLFSVPSTSYTMEVQRMITHVTKDHIALTGLNFFSVTKTLLLTIIGTIASYEMVLLQLNPASLAHETTTSNITRVINPYCPNKTFTGT